LSTIRVQRLFRIINPTALEQHVALALAVVFVCKTVRRDADAGRTVAVEVRNLARISLTSRIQTPSTLI
jgi:hypothetical protein